MLGKQLYHGGSPNKVGFSAMGGGGGGVGDEYYTLMFGHGGSVAVNTFINPNTEDTSLPTIRGAGHYVPVDSVLLGISALAVRFTSFSANVSLVLHCRYNIAIGTWPSEIFANTGTLVASLDMKFPSTGGGFGYYLGASDMALNSSVPGGNMIHMACAGKIVNSVTGLVAWLHFKKV